LQCLDRLSSPWQLELSVGDDCGEVGCPVVSEAVKCPGTCGNGSIDPGEQCDDAVASAACTGTCRLRTTCGNGVVDPGEDCDGADLDGADCTDVGFTGGTLACSPSCTFDVDGCTFTSTTTTTPIIIDTTSTTVPPNGDVECDVTFSTPTSATFGALQYETDYSASSGGFVDGGSQVECTSLLAPSVIATFNDVEFAETLNTGVVALFGFDGPTDIARCLWRGSSVPVAGDFAITIVDASDDGLPPVSIPGAAVNITEIDCGGVTTTTTSTTTTTIGGGTTTTSGGAQQWQITFSSPSTEPAVGALQYEVAYTGGDFLGSAAGVDCSSSLSPSVIVAFNDIDAQSQLNAGFVALFGFAIPAELHTCVFESATMPTVGDFAITVVDASTTAIVPIVPFPTVEVSSIDPL
jgi:hypothetical protein